MTDFSNEFVIAQFPLGRRGEILPPEELGARAKRICDALSELGRADPCITYTRLTFGVQATAGGHSCVIVVELAPQAPLDFSLRTVSEADLAAKVLAEKRTWVAILEQAQHTMPLVSLNEALRGAKPFRVGLDDIEYDEANVNWLRKRLSVISKGIGSLAGNLEAAAYQLDLKGFDGRQWSDTLTVEGRLSRTSFGVALEFLNVKGLRRAQVHYAGLPLDMQDRLDRVTRERSKIRLMGKIGTSNRAHVPAVFHPESLPSST